MSENPTNIFIKVTTIIIEKFIKGRIGMNINIDENIDEKIS